MDGYHNALHLFPNPIPDGPAVKESKNSHLYYFGPGIHDVGKLQLKSNDSVYIAGGAVVYGSFIADNADNIHISGREVLDGGHLQRIIAGVDVRIILLF